MPKAKKLTVEAMKAEIQSTMKDLGCEISFDADDELSKYRRGAVLKVGELRAMPEGSVVWVWYREYGRPPRIDSAFRTNASADGSVEFSDGSSFGCDFEIGSLKDDEECVEDKCGEGEMKVCRAVPL